MDCRPHGHDGARKRTLTPFAMSLGFGVVQLDVMVVNVALDSNGRTLPGGDVGGLQWVVNAYTVAFAALILGVGALGDRIGAISVGLQAASGAATAFGLGGTAVKA